MRDSIHSVSENCLTNKDLSPSRVILDPHKNLQTNENLKESDIQIQNNNSEPDLGINSTVKVNFSNTSGITKEDVLDGVLRKLNVYRQNWQNIKKSLGSIETKIELKNSLYHDYLNEKDELTLKILIQILYEEVETLTNVINKNSVEHKNTIEKISEHIQEMDEFYDKISYENTKQKQEIENYRKILNTIDQEDLRRKYNIVNQNSFDLKNMKLKREMSFADLVDELNNREKMNHQCVAQVHYKSPNSILEEDIFKEILINNAKLNPELSNYKKVSDNQNEQFIQFGSTGNRLDQNSDEVSSDHKKEFSLNHLEDNVISIYYSFLNFKAAV